MHITLTNGQVKEYISPMSIKEIASDISISLGKSAIAGFIDNEIFDVNFKINFDCKLDIISKDSPAGIKVLNYTGALIAAKAIKETRVDFKFINIELDDEMFFVDFDCEETIKEQELELISKKINNLIEKNITITFDNEKNTSKFKQNEFLTGQNYKGIYLIDDLEIPATYISTMLSKDIKNFKLNSITGAYLNNDSSQKMIQRLSGFVRSSKQELDKYIDVLQVRKDSDHRKIGKEMDIFTFSNLIGQGLPIWLPNGAIIKNEIKKYLKQKEWEFDFIPIETPVIGTIDLYKISGHFDHYKENMFASMKMSDNEEFVLKPMSCPHHIQVYKNKKHSYRELPIRYCEHALQHRYESSGSLTGLERVRSMELTDSHIFARQDQIGQEFEICYKLISEVLKTFNIEIDYFSLSLRDKNNKEKYFNDDLMWDSAEQQLEQTLINLKIPYKKMIGEAAFYGPKLDIQCKTAIGHEITVSTIQLDFLLPNKFNVNYIDSNNVEKKVIMIHRGLIGTYERFISVLLEQTRGKLPFWLSPIQVAIIPVNFNMNNEYANKVKNYLKKYNIRCEINVKEERLSYKIRESQIRKIPYQLVLGDKETESETITYRKYGSNNQYTMSISEFGEKLKRKILDYK
ncbi:threonine--tRNA ligase [Spiroplasma endosymbiont of Labia minor]|uniref:threonine--tRNA ligase n=1 Tax=Spiroplasma endosymbiont of Labia minor TaxID=3066305 RepID=UPI0030CC8D9B